MREGVMTITCQRKILRTIAVRAINTEGSDQLVRAHHFVVFVLEVMAVPDVFAWLAVEARDDAGDHPGVAAHGVFPAGFVGGRWYRWPGELQFLAGVPREEIERTALQYLEAHKVQVDGMRVARHIDERPGFNRALLWLFADGIAPHLSIEQHRHRIATRIVLLAQCKHAVLHRRGWIDALDLS